MEHDPFQTKLSAYHDGELAADLMNQISLHLRSCPACRKELEELNRVDCLFRSLPDLDVTEKFAFRVSAGITAGAAPMPVNVFRHIFAGFLQLAEVIFEMLPGRESRGVEGLDEFGDFPPLFLSSAYFQVIGR